MSVRGAVVMPHTKRVHSPKTRIRLNGYFKLALDISVNGCLSLYVGPAMSWRPVQGLPLLWVVLEQVPVPPSNFQMLSFYFAAGHCHCCLTFVFESISENCVRH